MIKTEIQDYIIHNVKISLCVPNNHDLFYQYKLENTHQLFPDHTQKSTFPYWAKVWHSAIALSEYIIENKELFYQKNILELASGLALPSFVASKYAASVICSDYIEDALYYMNESIQLNKLLNCTAQLLNWNNLSNNVDCDILLMSDVNYETNEFDNLEKVLVYFLQKNTTITLATPQRLMAKQFMEKIMPYCTSNIEKEINIQDEIAFINVLVLQNKLKLQ